MRAAGYIRVSTTEQAEEGHSLDAQRRAILDYCQERDRGWSVVIYEDAGYSGTSEDRPEFQRLLADAEARRFDVVVVWKLDRFSRDHILQGITIKRFAAQGVRLVALADGIDTETADWFNIAIRGLFNEQEARVIRERTRLGKRARARAGKTNASTTPYGYKREKIAITGAGGSEADDEPKFVLKEPEPDPDTTLAVILAFESYATGRYSDTTLADLLNRKGYKPSGRARSGRWTREGVRYLLTNPFYCGRVRHGDDLFPGQHDPIISQELFDEVQAVRARRTRSRGGRCRSDRVYLLAGLAVCSECGLNLVSQTSITPRRKPIAQYICPARRRAIRCNARKHLTRADVVNEQIGELIKQLRLPHDWRERLAELAEHREERKNIEGKRRYLHGKLRRLREVYIDGDLSRGEYARRRAELQGEIDTLREPEAPEVEEAGVTLESLADAWEGAPVRLRAEMLRTIFEKVVIDVAAHRLVCVKPYPPFVPLFRLDGLEEKEDGCFYPIEEEA